MNEESILIVARTKSPSYQCPVKCCVWSAGPSTKAATKVTAHKDSRCNWIYMIYSYLTHNNLLMQSAAHRKTTTELFQVIVLQSVRVSWISNNLVDLIKNCPKYHLITRHLYLANVSSLSTLRKVSTLEKAFHWLIKIATYTYRFYH